MLRRRQRAFTLIELVVAMVIAGILMALALPSFQSWVVNTRIRTVTTEFYAGLQQSRTEAIARNAQVRFQSVDTLNASCGLSTSGAGWVINRVGTDDTVAGRCNAAPDPSGATAPYILAKRAPDADSRVVVNASDTSLVFNALGKLAPVPAAAITYDFTATSNGGCASDGGQLTCLRVIVSPAGQVRMCNPRFPAGDPQACS